MAEQTTQTRFSFWKRFSLRTLFVIMTACCVALGIWSMYVAPFRDQARSLAVATKLGGEVESIPAKGPGLHRWLVTTMLGPDTFMHVESVTLSNRKVSDDDLRALGGLRFLKSLNLDQTPITDNGVDALTGFKNLRTLSLRYTEITDRGAASLAAMPELEFLALTGTNVTDESIDDLAKLTSLLQMFIRWTRITLVGANRLRQALPSCDVNYDPLWANVEPADVRRASP